MNKTTYWRRLQSYQGVRFAFVWSVFVIVIELLQSDRNWLIIFVALVCWMPVLILARESE